MKILVFALILLLPVFIAETAPIISFSGNDSAASNITFTNLEGTWNSGVYSVPYSDTNLVFSGNSLSGAPSLFGGLYATNPNIIAGPAAYLYRNSVTPDQFRIGWGRDGGNTNTSFRYVLMAASSSWITYSEGARFTDTSFISISSRATNQTSLSISFIIQEAGRYYISSQRLNLPNSTLTLRTGSVPTIDTFEGGSNFALCQS